MNHKELLKVKQFGNVLEQLKFALGKRQFYYELKSVGENISIEIKKCPDLNFNS